MNQRSSYLDTLNTGRPRRAQSSLDDLNRTLAKLEGQLSANRRSSLDEGEDASARMRRLDREISSRRPPETTEGARTAPHQADRAHGEAGSATNRSVLEELSSFRAEIRDQMTAALRREFESLRTEFMTSYVNGGSAATDKELAGELERLSDAIQTLAERGEDGNLKSLRGELADLKNTIAAMATTGAAGAREDRWDALERRLEDLVAHVHAPHMRDERIDTITNRLGQIGDAMERLPESLAVRSLEDRVRTLASAIDHFSRQSEEHHPASMAAIEERLDEISRAIVATSMNAGTQQFDEVIARVEGRIASLSAQLNELANDRPMAEVVDRLAELSRRVDHIGARAEIPDQVVQRLTSQLGVIAERLEVSASKAEVDGILETIDQRFGAMSKLFDQRQSDDYEQARRLFGELEARIEDVASRLEGIQSAGFSAESAMLNLIENRFAGFAERFERDPVDEAALRSIESRLASITESLERGPAETPKVDAEAVMRLERQVAAIAEHLARPSEEVAAIAPRLTLIEQTMAEDRGALLAAARDAANAAARAVQAQGEMPDYSTLAEDLRSLEALTRRSDERNGKTFEAIHDTLLKIVERLTAMEEVRGAPPRTQPVMPKAVMPTATMPAIEAPSIAPDIAPDIAPAGEAMEAVDEQEPVSRPGRSPATAAAEAALAAVEEEPAGEKSGPRSAKPSLFGSMKNALSRRKAKPAERIEPAPAAEMTAVDAAKAETLDLDAPLDPKIANRPLAPGSGTPDLNAIMKRVRDERGLGDGAKSSDAARSDFIAAARRAAQAAAAETDVMKRGADKSTSGSGFTLSGLFKGRRKTLLMGTAALVVVLAGMQIGKQYLGGTDAGTAAADDPSRPAAVVAAAVPGDGSAEEAIDTAETDLATAPEELAVEAEAPLEEQASAEDDTAPQEDVTAATAPETPDGESAVSREAVATPSAQEASGPAADIAAKADDAGTGVEAAEPEAKSFTLAADTGPVALREAADAGDPAAVFEIGNRHADGKGVTADMAVAAKWFEHSAELGLAPAQFRIGNLYEKGIGVERDIAKAKTWYQLAAGQGNASAMHNLAVLFAMGADGTTDNESAARWFHQAAEHGVKDSQFNLGILAAKGVGMQQDLVASYKWFALVAKTGDKDAAAKRDEIAKTLTPEQLEKARGETELWQAKPLDPQGNSVTIPDAWAESEDRTASVDMKQAVKTVQIILNKNGYDAGSIDGVMGAKTRSAIASFQKDNDMTATGEIDASLVKVLLAKK